MTGDGGKIGRGDAESVTQVCCQYECKFAASGNATACGTAALNTQTGELSQQTEFNL